MQGTLAEKALDGACLVQPLDRALDRPDHGRRPDERGRHTRRRLPDVLQCGVKRAACVQRVAWSACCVRQPLEMTLQRTLQALGDAAQLLMHRLDERLHPLAQRATIEAVKHELNELPAQVRQRRERRRSAVARLAEWITEADHGDETALLAHT